MTERGAALEAGDIEAVVTVALLSQWFDGAPRGYLKRNINTNIMQQGVGVDSPTVIFVGRGGHPKFAVQRHVVLYWPVEEEAFSLRVAARP